jgi:hypothetical protein
MFNGDDDLQRRGVLSVLWVAAFALFLRYYAVMFFTPRPDGGLG